MPHLQGILPVSEYVQEASGEDIQHGLIIQLVIYTAAYH
jgi:hypothetical protein